MHFNFEDRPQIMVRTCLYYSFVVISLDMICCMRMLHSDHFLCTESSLPIGCLSWFCGPITSSSYLSNCLIHQTQVC